MTEAGGTLKFADPGYALQRLEHRKPKPPKGAVEDHPTAREVKPRPERPEMVLDIASPEAGDDREKGHEGPYPEIQS